MDKPKTPTKPAGETPPDAKLTIKLGENEIHLEARPEIVRQELDRLMDRLLPAAAAGVGADSSDQVVVAVTAPPGAAAHPPEPVAAPPGAAEPAKEASSSPEAKAPPAEPGAKPPPPEPAATALDFIVRSRGRQGIQPVLEKRLRHVTLDPERLTELYAVDAGSRVLLQKLPQTQHQVRDTVLLLLYGALTMCGEPSESGYRLVQAVRGLGLRIERVPREFGPEGELAGSFGRHRGKRYRLTPAGIRHCEKLIPGLLRTLRS